MSSRPIIQIDDDSSSDDKDEFHDDDESSLLRRQRRRRDNSTDESFATAAEDLSDNEPPETTTKPPAAKPSNNDQQQQQQIKFIDAPSTGSLGIKLVYHTQAQQTGVAMVHNWSPLLGQIHKRDVLLSVNGISTKHLSSDDTKRLLIQQQGRRQRQLKVWVQGLPDFPTPTKSLPLSPGGRSRPKPLRKPPTPPRTAAAAVAAANCSTRADEAVNEAAPKSPPDDDNKAAAPPNNDETPLEKPAAFFETHCWNCHVLVVVGRTNANNNLLYASHQHPVLNIPVCSTCSEDIVAATATADDDDDDNANTTTVCLACGYNADDDDDCLLDLAVPRNSGVFYSCDKCHRDCCLECVAQALESWEAARALESKHEEEWHCLECAPPAPLQSIQKQALQQQEQQEKQQQQQSGEERVQQLLYRLGHAEDALEQAQKDFEDASLEQKRLEIRQELLHELNDNDDELEEHVQAEMTRYERNLARHDARIRDMIALLQDELEQQHKVDLAKMYTRCMKIGGTTSRRVRQEESDDSSDDEDEDRPEWVRKADKAVKKAMKARREDCKEEPPPPDDSKQLQLDSDDCYDEVDELASDVDDETVERVALKGYSQLPKPSEQVIAMVLRQENEKMRRLRVGAPRKATDRADALEILQEEECRSRRRQVSLQRRQKHVARATSGGVAAAARPAAGDIAVIPRKKKRASLVSLPKKVDDDDRKMPSSSQPLPLPPPAEEDADIPGIQSPEKPLRTRRWTIQHPNLRHFKDSSVVLCQKGESRLDGDDETSCRRTISIATTIADKLKEHQIEGANFIWRNCFADLETNTMGGDKIGGCILAHSMGLGKTLTAIAVLHSVLHHPALLSAETEEPTLKTVLLVVPVNTIANWEKEIEKWTGHMNGATSTVYDMASVDSSHRKKVVERWKNKGGILLASDKTYSSLCKMEWKDLLQPDIVVLDEAHTMLKKTDNVIFKALNKLVTPRRLLLTGSPFQNNLMEYFLLVRFCRPNVLNVANESEFDKVYVAPIMQGMASDASQEAVQRHEEKSQLLKQQLDPYVHRKDASELRKHLPPMQQAVIYVKPSRTQNKLLNYHNKLRKTDEKRRNFLQTYADLRPIHNHPGCLLSTTASASKKKAKDDAAAAAAAAAAGDEDVESGPWWEGCLKEQRERDALSDVSEGGKLVLLLHILAHAHSLGEKVLLFSQCLKSLDFIETVLTKPDWSLDVPSLKKYYDNVGGWKKHEHFVRIDGQVNAGERGQLVDEFNGESSEVRLFLLSSLAGGMGINLHSANRVVLYDSHFNPTVCTQSLFRAYRYGQKKHVYCYRLLTEGTMEQKVYARCVNKDGVALCVIDGKSINRVFSSNEVEDLQQNLFWVKCDNCDKWRVLLGSQRDEIDEDAYWDCSMNKDPLNNSCMTVEKTAAWYEFQYGRNANNNNNTEQARPTEGSPASKCVAMEEQNKLSKASSMQSEEEKQQLVDQDVILQRLLEVQGTRSSVRKKATGATASPLRSPSKQKDSSKLISDFFFHDSLFDPKKDGAKEAEVGEEEQVHAVDESSVKRRATSKSPARSASRTPKKDKTGSSRGRSMSRGTDRTSSARRSSNRKRHHEEQDTTTTPRRDLFAHDGSREVDMEDRGGSEEARRDTKRKRSQSSTPVTDRKRFPRSAQDQPASRRREKKKRSSFPASPGPCGPFSVHNSRDTGAQSGGRSSAVARRSHPSELGDSSSSSSSDEEDRKHRAKSKGQSPAKSGGHSSPRKSDSRRRRDDKRKSKSSEKRFRPSGYRDKRQKKKATKKRASDPPPPPPVSQEAEVIDLCLSD